MIGRTEKLVGYAVTHPFHFDDILATDYHNLRIAARVFAIGLSGMPIPIPRDSARAVEKLV